MTRSPLQVQRVVDLLDAYGPDPVQVAIGVASFLVVYLVGRLVVLPAVVRLVAARNPDNRTLVEAADRFARLGVLVAATFFALAAVGYGRPLGGSALVVAAATLALGVAGQEVIGNLVSGLFLVLDPEFNVDDWIVWEDGEGSVEAIRFRVTRVRTPDNEVITVPNTTLATTAVRRPYSRDRFRLVVRIHVGSDADLAVAADAILAALENVDAVLADPPPGVDVEEIGPDAIRLRASAWVRDPDHSDVVEGRSACVRGIQERLLAEGVAFSPASAHELSGRVRVDRPDRPG